VSRHGYGNGHAYREKMAFDQRGDSLGGEMVLRGERKVEEGSERLGSSAGVDAGT